MGLSVIIMMNAGLPTKVKTLDNIGLEVIGLVSYLVRCAKSYTDCTEYTYTNKKRLYFINLRIRLNYRDKKYSREKTKYSLSRRRIQALSVFVLRRLHVTPLGFCLRLIVNEAHRNLEKTTSNVLSVI